MYLQQLLKDPKVSLAVLNPYIKIKEMRKHVAWYTAGLPHSAAVRRECNHVESLRELQELVSRLCGNKFGFPDS